MTTSEKLKLLALDLRKNFPRSPRETLGGFVVAARTLDKCRAVVAGTEGEYHFDCPLDQTFLGFAGIAADDFKACVATGATDEEVAAWIQDHSKVTEKEEIVRWNNRMRYMRPCDMEPDVQMFLEGYIKEFIPRNRPIYVWFDVYDIEEERI